MSKHKDMYCVVVDSEVRIKRAIIYCTLARPIYSVRYLLDDGSIVNDAKEFKDIESARKSIGKVQERGYLDGFPEGPEEWIELSNVVCRNIWFSHYRAQSEEIDNE